LSPVVAMSGDAARVGSLGGTFRQAGLRLPLALPLRLGVATALAHPTRAVMTLGAIVVGVAAITFSSGLDASLLRGMEQLDRTSASPVRVEAPPEHSDAVSAMIAAQPNTAHAVAIGDAMVTVPRVGGMPFVGYREGAGWLGYALISGRWFAGPGEA